MATGAALGGAVVDRAGSVGGFTLVVGFGLLLVVGVLLVRTPTTLVQEAEVQPAR